MRFGDFAVPPANNKDELRFNFNWSITISKVLPSTLVYFRKRGTPKFGSLKLVLQALLRHLFWQTHRLDMHNTISLWRWAAPLVNAHDTDTLKMTNTFRMTCGPTRIMPERWCIRILKDHLRQTSQCLAAPVWMYIRSMPPDHVFREPPKRRYRIIRQGHAHWYPSGRRMPIRSLPGLALLQKHLFDLVGQLTFTYKSGDIFQWSVYIIYSALYCA